MNKELTLQIENVIKNFPGVLALDKVSLNAFSNEVLGLVGVNGAGKSTLMNVLGGLIKPDAGTIIIDGKSVEINSPEAAEKLGIVFIHQEIQLFFNLTVFENVYLTKLQKYKKFKCLPFLNKKILRQKTEEFLKMLGCDVSPNQKVDSLSVGEQQMVQIARALSLGGRILLFDEPTSSLSMKEKDKLFDVIRNLKKSGHTIIFISHYLDEVEEICDRVVVMRDGKIAGIGPIEEMNKVKVSRLMLGVDVEFIETAVNVSNEVVFEVKNLSGIKYPKNISFKLYKGEVLGLWGLLGSGRTETIRTIIGLDNAQTGEFYLQMNGELKRVKQKTLLKLCGYVTEGRHFDGLYLPMPIWENISSVNLKRYSSKFLSILNKRNEKAEGLENMRRLHVVAPNQFVSVQQLSGGNQQKVSIAKWLSKKPMILFLDEPTRGVDVGSKVQIQNIIRQFAYEGMSCIVISSELEEIQRLCDRVFVLSKGMIVTTLTKKEMSSQNLINKCLGEN